MLEGNCIPLSNLYSHGPGAGDAALTRQDDGYSPLITLSESFSFFGTSSNLLFVSVHDLLMHVYALHDDNIIQV